MTDIQLDVIRELFTLGAGRAADVLNTYLDSHIQLKIPLVKILSSESVKGEFEHLEVEHYSSVEMGFSQSLQGTAELVFLTESASLLVEAITGSDDYRFHFDEIKIATFSEIGNIIINAVMGTVMNELNLPLTFSIPNFYDGTIGERIESISDSVILKAQIDFSVEKLNITGNILFLFNVVSFSVLLSAIDVYIKQP